LWSRCNILPLTHVLLAIAILLVISSILKNEVHESVIFLQEVSLTYLLKSAHLLKIDVDKAEYHVDYKKINIGFNAETSVKELAEKKKVSDKAVLEFRVECNLFLLTIVKKLLVKAPILYSLVRHLSTFDPREMIVENLEHKKTQLKSIVCTFIEANRVSASDADDIMQQYSEFIQGSVSQVSTLLCCWWHS